MVFDANGLCRFSNPFATDILCMNPGVDPLGKSMQTLLGTEVAAERMALVGKVVASQQTVAIRQIVRGHCSESTIFHVKNDKDATPFVLVTTRFEMPIEPEPYRNIPVSESKFMELGPLDCLSDKELMLLVHIGKGWPLKRIASQLRTPIRTIENRRATLGKKLDANSLVALAKTAHLSGIDDHHLALTRVKAPGTTHALKIHPSHASKSNLTPSQDRDASSSQPSDPS